MESSSYTIDELVKRGIMPVRIDNQITQYVSLRETFIVESESNAKNVLSIDTFPAHLPEVNERLLRALRCELTQNMAGKGMASTTKYFAPPVQSIWHGTSYGRIRVDSPFNVAKIIFYHTPESEEIKEKAIERRKGAYPLKNGVSLRNALVFFLEPGKAIFRVTSNAMEIGAKVSTQNTGQPKEVRLPGHTYGGMRIVNIPQTHHDPIESGIQIILPPNHNGFYNPIFDDKKRVPQYLRVWEHLPGVTYSRAMPYQVEQLPR